MNYDHIMETVGTSLRCSKCLRTSAQINRSRRWCPGVPWYVAGAAPDTLYTVSQLKAKGLRPCKNQPRAGVVVTAYHDVVALYDITFAQPRKIESEKQRVARLATWAKTQEKWRCEHCGQIPDSIGDLTNYWIEPGLCEACKGQIQWQADQEADFMRMERDHREVCEWAADLFAHPETWALVDTETTSLNGVIVEIAIVDAAGTVLFESLVNPDGTSISSTARGIHGLTDEELAAAPRLPEIWGQIVEALSGRTKLVAYNAAFDAARIEQSAARYNLPIVTQQWECAMEAYAAFCGNWSEYHGNYRWIPLDGGHRAADDCRAALAHLHEMASAYSNDITNFTQEQQAVEY